MALFNHKAKTKERQYNKETALQVVRRKPGYCIVHVYPPFTRKRIVSLYFGRDVRPRFGVVISEVYGRPVFHIKVGASS